MDEEYFNDMQKLFETAGWARVVADAEDSISVRKDRLVFANSLDELRYVQGEIAQLQVLANLEVIVKNRQDNETAVVEEDE